MKFVFTVLVFLIFSLSGHSYAHADREVTFTNVPSQLQLQLFNKVPALKSESPRLNHFDKAIEFLMNTDRYEFVKVYRSTAGWNIVATPLKILAKIQFSGNSLNSSDLLEKIKIAEGERFDRRRVIEAGGDLKQHYADLGYYQTVIEIKFTEKSEGDVNVTFDIKEKEPCLTHSIVFRTKNKNLQKDLYGQVSSFLGKPFTNASISEIETKVNDFLRTHRYLKARLKQETVFYNRNKTKAELVYSIDNPYLYELIIEGNKKLSNFELRVASKINELNALAIDPGKLVRENIEDHYIKKGYANAVVNSYIRKFKKSKIRQIRIKIKENPRVFIKRIEIVGKISKSAEFYIDFIKNNSSDLVHNGIYNAEDLKLAYASLESLLHNEGFLRAKVIFSRVNFNKRKDEATVTVGIEEGPLTQIRRITFRGTKAFSRIELLENIDLNVNSPLNQNELVKSIEKLKRFYLEKGYLEMKLLNEDSSLVNYNESGTQASLRFNIYEGPQIIVSSILIQGNTFTKSRVVRSSLTFKVGDVLTPEHISDTETRLNRLGIFGVARVSTLEEGSNISQRTVVITVSDKDPGLFRFGAGLDTRREGTVKGFTGVSYNNLWGTARSIGTRLELSHPKKDQYLEKRFITYYAEPFLLQTSATGRFTYTHSDQVFNFQDSTARQSDRVDFSIEDNITKFTRLTWSLWSLDIARDKRIPKSDRGVTLSERQIGGFGPVIDVDYRDNPFQPTKGFYFSWDMQHNSPEMASSENIRFIKSDASFTYYQRLFDSPQWLWVNSLSGGYIRNLSRRDGSGIPNSRIFLLGGAKTVRGFGGEDRIPHQVPPSAAINGNSFNIQNSNDIVVDARTSFYMIKSEMRFPVEGNWGGVLFYDAAEVSVYRRGLGKINFKRPFRQTVGLGVRYNTPVGPISVDVGFKLRPLFDQELGVREDKFRVHLNFGTF